LQRDIPEVSLVVRVVKKSIQALGGINDSGGAEQLVVNAAVALQRRGHTVHIFTSHHDPKHCFAETVGTGELSHFPSHHVPVWNIVQ
jgi:hypothetical protein